MALDAAKMICDSGLTCWDRVAKYRKYIRSLDENLKAIERKVADLGGVYTEVNRLVETAEAEGWIRNSVADGWLKNAETFKKEADKIVADGKRIAERKCLCGICFWNCRPRYKQSRLAEAKKADVEEELSQGRTFRVKEDVAYETGNLILKRSVEVFHLKMHELHDFFETVKQRVESEKKRYQKPTPQVDGWLKRVEDLLEKKAREVLEKGERELETSRQRVGGDSQGERNFSSIRISKSIDKTRDILEEMLSQGRGFVVYTVERDDLLMLEIPSERHVGAESLFKEIWDWVEDEKVRCIGLFGMGGVGKTNLLVRVHNRFLKVRHDYNFVLWVLVSRPVNLDKIQEAILEKLNVSRNKWDKLDRTSRAALILSMVKEENILLFLDDLWDSIDLLKDIGIPCHEHLKKCKIIFTTRDERVCDSMKSDKKKKVECLPPDEALRLFRQKLGEETWGAQSGIPMIAATLVHECKYLPLALITVAKAMAGKTQLKDWMKAEKDLKSRQSKFSDMSEKVLAILEFSYANLPDETHRKCFLYLSIFPEDHEIYEADVINLWIGEGFLDEYGDAHEARGYGEEIFRRLRHTCLVEFMTYSVIFGSEIVKMHDVIQEMALWVRSEHGLKPNRVLFQEELKSFGVEELKKWKDAEWISLWRARARFGDALTTVSCSQLSTLIVRDTSLKIIPDELFSAIPCLRVLDLSDNDNLDYVPSSVWELTKLRYLKIEMANERIIHVPTRIKNLNNLVVLILSRNFVLPVGVIPNISSLRVFNWSTFHEDCGFKDKIVLLEELQMNHSIEEISVSLFSGEGAKKLLDCSDLLRRLRGLYLYKCDGLGSLKISTSSLKSLEHLQSLTLVCVGMRWIEITGEDEGFDGRPQGCPYVESLPPSPSSFASMDSFRSLRHVIIHGCEELVDLTSLIYHAPFLEWLDIRFCPLLNEVIAGDIEDSDITNNRLFACLTYLILDHLESLTRICRKALPFPSLKEIKVVQCPLLMELPLNSDSAKTLQVIRGKEEWWEGLKWDDPASKQVFSTKFDRRYSLSPIVWSHGHEMLQHWRSVSWSANRRGVDRFWTSSKPFERLD